MKTPDILTAIGPLIEAFDQLGIHYYIGGSVAGSTYGIARATLDVDMVSDIKQEHVESLVQKLKQEYYVSGNMIFEAINHYSSFNIIHLETMFKVDIFILKEAPYHQKSFKRRKKEFLDKESNAAEFYIGSAEDIILHKLDWYRSTGYSSERQWKDVLGIIKVQTRSLDFEYLKHWASELGLLELINKVFKEADISLE